MCEKREVFGLSDAFRHCENFVAFTIVPAFYDITDKSDILKKVRLCSFFTAFYAFRIICNVPETHHSSFIEPVKAVTYFAVWLFLWLKKVRA